MIAYNLTKLRATMSTSMIILELFKKFTGVKGKKPRTEAQLSSVKTMQERHLKAVAVRNKLHG